MPSTQEITPVGAYTWKCRCNICGAVHNEIVLTNEHGECGSIQVVCCGEQSERIYGKCNISYSNSGHLYEYKAVAADVASGGKPPVITSKTQHKEFLKRNGYVEVGNETPKPRAPVQLDSPRNEIKKAMQQVLG
jgi:hypothetical protein